MKKNKNKVKREFSAGGIVFRKEPEGTLWLVIKPTGDKRWRFPKGKIEGKIEESYIEREEFERKEGFQRDNSFSREVMFKNAPEKNKDFIIGEKKKW